MTHLDPDAIKKQIGFDAFPIQTSVLLPDGKNTLHVTLESIKHADRPAAIFDIPADYTKQDTGLGQGRPSGPPG